MKCIINNAHLCKHIKEIWMFGSGLEERCNEDSDLDVCIVFDGVGGKLHKLYNLKSYNNSRGSVISLYDLYDKRYRDVDFLHSTNIERDAREMRVFKEVLDCGVCIYRRV